jgi:DNA-directed RNA polymerase subunit RPC12/RpoP
MVRYNYQCSDCGEKLTLDLAITYGTAELNDIMDV